MSDIFGSIAHGLGSLLMFLYNNLWLSYGLAIVFFTIIIRIVLLPLSIKSFNAMAKMSEIQPLVAELQRKYKNDQETLNKEVMKLYQEKKANPFGGCLPLLLQIPVLWALFMVISQPLTYMLKDAPQLVAEKTMKYGNVQYKEVLYVKEFKELNYDFLFINLGDKPQFGVPVNLEQFLLLLIPVIIAVTTYLSSKYSQLPTQKTEQTETQAMMQKQMLIMMPLMSAWFSFVVPAGLSLYWIVSSIFQFIQQKMLINLYLKKKKEEV